MSISDRTRKMLWAKSGNRCMICRIELIQGVGGSSANLIVGEECHIVSGKENGPRGSIEFLGEIDSYDNLVLLCANDHKRIDELTDIYTPEKLQQCKSVHEAWVKSTLEKDVIAFANDELNIKSLQKIISGKQLIDVIRGAQLYDYRPDDLTSETEASEVGGFFDELKDYGDILSEMGYAEVAKWELHLNEEIEKLHQMGFVLFGLSRQLRLHNQKTDLGVFNSATVVAVREDNPGIVGDFLILHFPRKVNLI